MRAGDACLPRRQYSLHAKTLRTYQSANVITVDSRLNLSVPAASEEGHPMALTIVDIIETPMGVFGIIDYEWTTQSVTQLRRNVGMIPERPSLIEWL